MSQPLHLVDEHGEIIRSSCPACNEHIRDKDNLVRDREVLEAENRRLLRNIAAMKKDKERERESYRQRARVEGLWQMYQEIVGKKSSKLGAARFDAIKRMVELGYTDEHFECAFYGAKVDPFVDAKGRRFDELELVCRNEAKIESFANKGAAAVKSRKLAMEQEERDA
jgi:hypothetical protein